MADAARFHLREIAGEIDSSLDLEDFATVTVRAHTERPAHTDADTPNLRWIYLAKEFPS